MTTDEVDRKLATWMGWKEVTLEASGFPAWKRPSPGEGQIQRTPLAYTRSKDALQPVLEKLAEEGLVHKFMGELWSRCDPGGISLNWEAAWIMLLAPAEQIARAIAEVLGEDE